MSPSTLPYSSMVDWTKCSQSAGLVMSQGTAITSEPLAEISVCNLLSNSVDRAAITSLAPSLAAP